MKYRRLRIAVSVFFALVALAFAVLWIASHFYHQVLSRMYTNKGGFIAESADGEIAFQYFDLPVFQGIPGYTFRNRPAGRDRATTTMKDFSTAGFLYQSGPQSLVFIIPDWFLVMLFGLGSAAFAFNPMARFSLRTMLIAMTLIAVALGLAMWATRAPKSPPLDWVDDPSTVPLNR